MMIARKIIRHKDFILFWLIICNTVLVPHYMYKGNCLLNLEGLFLFQHIAEQMVHIEQNNNYRIVNPWQLHFIALKHGLFATMTKASFIKGLML